MELVIKKGKCETGLHIPLRVCCGSQGKLRIPSTGGKKACQHEASCIVCEIL